MPTMKQRKLAEEIVKDMENPIPSRMQDLLERGGYSKTVALAKPGEILDQIGVKQALKEFGFNEESAKRVVTEIMGNSENDVARLKATDQVFKVLGSYAPEKNQSLNVNVDITKQPDEVQKILEESEAKLLAAMSKKE